MAEPTLRKKLLGWLLLPLSALFLLDAAASYFVAVRLSDAVYDRELAEIGRELLLHAKAEGDGLTFDLPEAARQTLLIDQYDKLYFKLTDGGRLVAGDPGLPDPPRGGDSQFYDGVIGGEPVRVMAASAPLQGAPAHRVRIRVAETLNKRRIHTWEILVSGMLPQLVLILIAGLLVWGGVARGLSPLKRLKEAVASRSHLDLSPVEGEGVPAEVKPLVAAINDLMVRLNEVLDFQNRFIADAAHQLRTPVAGLKAHIEVALRETDLARAKEALAHLYTGVQRLSRLVSQLLSLARNDPNAVKSLRLESLDLNRLVFEATTEWVPEAYKKNIDLGFEGAEGPVMIEGEPFRLRELVNNLLDNAIRYTREGGQVTVQVFPEPRPGFSVSDDGPRIPPQERQRVFERFHRLLGGQGDGSGLGLAIVSEIARMHNAEVLLDEDPDGVGNTFTVSFPPAH